MDTLGRYVALLEHWQQKLNLVGPATLKDVWQRHIADSLELLPLLPPGPCLTVDLGTGAGLPGIPIAAIEACATLPSITQAVREFRKRCETGG
jgi:16S rRNA (guanine527-N7)-methyltransferase